MLSFWEKNSFTKYDYVIIGAGILGLSTACELKKQFPGREILVLERGIFPTGASTKNAGFLCFGSLTEILADIKIKGEQNAVKLVENRWKGINLLKQRIPENKMGYVCYGGYELINEKHSDAIDKIEYVNDLLKDVLPNHAFELKNSKVDEFGFNKDFVKSIIYSSFEAQIDTGELMRWLLKYTQSIGINVIHGCEAKEVTEGSVKVFNDSMNETVEFESGCTIVCANAFTQKLLPEFSVTPGRGQVIITKPVNGLKFKGIFHIDEGYYYFRNYGNRVIFGGGRNIDFKNEETLEFATSDTVINDLKHKMDNVILPGVKYEIEHTWAGVMGFTEDRLPDVESIDDNVYAAVCCNGMGIALSSFIAKELVNLVS